MTAKTDVSLGWAWGNGTQKRTPLLGRRAKPAKQQVRGVAWRSGAGTSANISSGRRRGIWENREWATNSRNAATRRRVSMSTTRVWSCETPARLPSSRRVLRLPTVQGPRATRIPKMIAAKVSFLYEGRENPSAAHGWWSEHITAPCLPY